MSETTKRNTKYSHKHYSESECDTRIFLQVTSKEETANIISPLNSNKASGSNSRP